MTGAGRLRRQQAVPGGQPARRTPRAAQPGRALAAAGRGVRVRPDGRRSDATGPRRRGAAADRRLDRPRDRVPSAWSAHLKTAARAMVGTGGTVRPPLEITLTPPDGQISGDAELTISGKPSAVRPRRHWPAAVGWRSARSTRRSGSRPPGTARHARPRSSRVSRAASSAASWSSTPRTADGFISHAARRASGSRPSSTSGFGFDARTRASTSPAAARSRSSLPLHLALGPGRDPGDLTLRSRRSTAASFPIELAADIKAELGPLTAVVEQIGVTADLELPGRTAATSARSTSRFALQAARRASASSLDAGVVKGGGYLFIDPDRGEYAGALELDVRRASSRSRRSA